MHTRLSRLGTTRFVERTFDHATVIEGSFPAGFQGGRHAHDGHHWLFVVAGCIEDHGLPRADRFDSSTVRESPSADRHLLRAPVASRVLLITLKGSVDTISPRMPARRRVHNAARFPRLDALCRALGDTEPDALEIEEYVLTLFADDRDPRKAPPPWLVALRDRLHDEWRSGLTLGGICRDIGISREHVARQFREHYRCTMGEYIRRRQLAFVREGLRGDLPLAVLAREAGFADQSHMTRAVRRAFGAPPRMLRARLAIE